MAVTETSGAKLRSWLLGAMSDLGGSGPRQAVHSKVEELFGDEFTADDIAARVGRAGGEAAWRNNLDSLYDRMKKSGHMETLPARSPWTLAPSGTREALALAPRAPKVLPAIAESDLLSDFKPKDSGDYLSHVRGRVLVKSRSHEQVLRDYGTAIVRHGWAPSTSVHPRDLELRRGNEVCLAEIKVVYKGNATHAVREAVGQLMEYRHFHYSEDLRPVPLAVFSEAVGDGFVAYLQALGIAVVWQHGAAWRGSTKATRLGLVPTQ